MTDTIAQRLGLWSSELQLNNVSHNVIEKAKHCLIDITGVTLAGSKTEPAQRVYDSAVEHYGKGPCAILGQSATLKSTGAALVNGVAAHASNIEDNHYLGIVHNSATIYPAVLAAAQYEGVDGKTLLNGFIVGIEVGDILGKALAKTLYQQGWCNTSVLGTIGAAAGCARILGLNANETSCAIALAAAGSGGFRATQDSNGKPYLNGRAAEAGLYAALLSARGATAPENIFEDSKGFLHVFNHEAIDNLEIHQIGEAYNLQSHGTNIKHYPAFYTGRTASNEISKILTEHNLIPDDIVKLIYEVPEVESNKLTFSSPITPYESRFNLHFAIAANIAFGEITLDHLTMETLSNKKLKKMLLKVEVRISERPIFCLEKYQKWAFITLITNDGNRYEKFIEPPVSSVTQPMSRLELDSVFMESASHVLGKSKSINLLDNLHRIESVSCINELNFS